MINSQFFTYKFNSSRLKEFNFKIDLSFEEAQKYNEVITLFDNQILRSIRELKNSDLDPSYIDALQEEKEKLKKKTHQEEYTRRLQEIQSQLNNILFVPEYITIKMDHISHYKYLFNEGLYLNGKRYVRFSSSAGQARVSTVVFLEEETAKALTVVLDNGRDLTKKLVPSKFNAYKGLAGSATKVVSTPRFCLVPDYYSDTEVKVNFVTETDLEDDDIIDIQDIVESFNRFDGQGLISYEMAEKWAAELGLDYVPAQWCIRQNFIKGMLNTFPIHEFCETVNNGNYRIRTSYKDENGNLKIADLRDIDVILTESQFKLWDSFPSIEVYKENCIKNNLRWGISLHSPKKDKDILKMNYQFLQTLNLNNEDIENICEKFVNWITGVNGENIYYSILFLIGTDITDDKIENYLNKSDNHWIKALIVNPDLINDKYIKKKIYDLMKKKIQRGCLGDIILDGNFQTLVSDPYAMMQHICGLEVTGLLGKREYYSNYWNKKGVKYVDSMRAPPHLPK
ncbi:RNA dependent RNA polymerase [Bacillus velezensis]